ncbi:hypothetical protein ACFQE1_02465 [Halobium palmae]|uniref:Uncharacterized protein n=1 Tax=Halobium palmae TaxID=1776492 RepID=A0ABD5RVL9_9EURY
MHWRDPRDAAIVMAKFVLALVGAIVVTALVMIILPFGDYSPRTPGRAVQVGVFYTTWALLAFRLVLGEYIPRRAFKNDGA